MKNRKKPLIYERVKRKLSKLFAYISANRFDILKRVACGCSTFVLACCLVIPFISNNKALALSNPIVKPVWVNTYTGFYHNFVIDLQGAINANLNPTEPQIGVGNGNMNGYGSYLGQPTSNLLTTIDQTRTNGSNISNDYYDGSAQNSNIYLRQSYNSSDRLYLQTYRVHNVTMYLTQPTILYLGDNKRALQDFKVFFYNPVGRSVEDYDSGNVTGTPKPFNMRSTNQITCMQVNFYVAYTNSNNEEVQLNYTSYTNLSSINDSNALSMPSELINQIALMPQTNNCVLFNAFTVEITFWQRTYLSASLNWSNGNTPSSSNPYSFEFYLEKEKTEPGYIRNIYNEPLYASNVYIYLPFYTENMEETLNITRNAHNIYLDKMFSDYVTINDFWLELVNFEIFPGFKLSYMLTISLGLVLVIIFVRMFR